MKNYRNFSEWDLAEDADFVSWVLHPNNQSDKFWNEFLSDNPNKSDEISLAKEIVSNMSYGHSPQLDISEYDTLYKRIQASKRTLERGSVRTTSYYSLKPWIKYAAAVVLVIASIIFYSNHTIQTDIVVSEQSDLLIKESPKGSQLSTILSDGTKVRLNSGSKITYPKQFNDSVRLIQLSGEAFFEVQHNPSKPFIVVAGNVNTTVLGTSFNVQAYPEDNKVQVAVQKGKVKVANGRNSNHKFQHTLLPYQMSEVDIENGNAMKLEFEGNSLFSWTQWKLIIKQEPLNKILKRLERWYGVEFEVKSNINHDKTFTGSFNNDPLKVILEALKSQDAFTDYQINQNEIIIN